MKISYHHNYYPGGRISRKVTAPFNLNCGNVSRHETLASSLLINDIYTILMKIIPEF